MQTPKEHLDALLKKWGIRPHHELVADVAARDAEIRREERGICADIAGRLITAGQVEQAIRAGVGFRTPASPTADKAAGERPFVWDWP